MAINKNHEFEDIAGVKYAIVEKNASKERAAFLKDLLEHNKFTVIIAPSPPPKAKAAPVTENQDAPVQESPVEETFTIGVTDMMFNPVNAVFGRFLRTAEGKVVTLAYWEQKEKEPKDMVPYYEK
jgi:hypothetical protein